MTSRTADMSHEDFAAYMRAKRGVLPKSDDTVEPVPKPKNRVPIFPADPEPEVELGGSAVLCCSNQELRKKPHKKGSPTGLYECLYCHAVQYDSFKCYDKKYRRTGRTQTLLEYAVRRAMGVTPTAVYFVAHSKRYAEQLSERTCDWCQKEEKFFKGRERDQVYFHNGGRIFFVSFDQLQGRGFKPGESDLIIYDHYQSIHFT